MSYQDKLYKLGQRVDKTLNELEIDREKKKTALERQKIINEAPQITITDFWCADCQLDFLARAVKRVIFGSLRAVYEAKCLKCQEVRERRITDKLSDPYWNQSRFVALQRRREQKAMLQPGQVGFNTLYGDPFAKQYKEREDRERKEYEATH